MSDISLTDVCNRIMSPTKRVSVLIPTRGRPTMMFDALKSCWENESGQGGIEYLIALDDDDQKSIDYFTSTIIPYMDEHEVDYQVFTVPRLGYIRLNEYLNYLASRADGAWYLFFNDDSRMKTKDWDNVIEKHNGKFKILRCKSNHEHPYAIFPIIPHEYFVLTGSIRYQTCAKIMWYLKQKGQYNDHFEKILNDAGPAWDILEANDAHGLTKRRDHNEKYTPYQSASKEEVARRGGK